MPLDTLENTFAHDLADLLSAENQFAKALQLVVKSADSETVRQMAATHLEETKQHAENLKEAFTILGEKPEKGVVCKAAQGIVEECTSTLKEEKPKGAIKDLTLLGSSLRIEHYEIAGYSAAIAVAKQLGYKEITRILQGNLTQEKATAKKLMDASPQIVTAASQPPVPKTRAPKAAS